MTKAEIVNEVAKATGIEKATVQIVVESFMESVKGWKNLLYLSEIYISYRKAVPLAGLLVKLDESVVLHQRYRDFSWIYINNQVFYGLHQEFQ